MKKNTFKKMFLEQLRKMPINQIVCEKLNLSRSTVHAWRKEDAEFAKAYDDALLEGEALVTDMSETQLITMIREGNFSAVQLWLRHHHLKYGNKLEISGSIKAEQEISPEQQALINETLGHLPGRKKVRVKKITKQADGKHAQP